MRKNKKPVIESVIESLRDGGELSATDLAKRIGCSPTIVQNYLNDLHYDGVVNRKDYYDGRGKNIVTYKYNRLRLFALRRAWTPEGMRGIG